MKKITLSTLIVALTLFSFGRLNAQDTIDLTPFVDPNVLLDTLDGIPDGALVLLQPGMTYNAGGYAFDSSVTIQSIDPLNLDRPKIHLGSNYDLADGTTIDSIVFKDLELYWDGTNDKYVINSTGGSTMGKVVIDGCYLHDMRGVFRMKGGTGSLDNFVISNSVVTRIGSYGILSVDVNTWITNNILFENSSISKSQTFITSRNNSTSVVIDGCTLHEYTSAGQRMFRWREAGQDNVLNGILIRNTLWGTGWDEAGTGNTGFDGFDGLASTVWTFENTYVTSDYDIADGKDSITGFNFVYAGTSSDLWVNPAMDSLHIADTITFAGYGNAGDQRWAAGSSPDGVEMNISTNAFNGLGTLVETQKVAGLNIYASSGKTVVVDGNNKTLGDMSFTDRMKLGGSAEFDADGMPLGRVLTIDLDHSAIITVAAMSSSSGSDRVLNVAAGNKDNLIGEHQALGASLTSSSFEYYGGPNTIMLYSPSSGVNVYYVKTGFLANIDSLLSDLSVSAGDLSPAFDPAVQAYTLLVPDGTTEVVVSGTAHDPNASVSDNDTVDVSSGSGTATITCVAEDGMATTVYTVDITVEAPPPVPAAITFIVDDTALRTSPGFSIKGSWNTATGEYDASWSGGAEHSPFYDDGTHGDETIGDNIWTVTLDLIPDGGANTWEWGVNDANGNWLDGNFQFTVTDETAQTLAPYVIEDPGAVEPGASSRYSIYPNPASSMLYIDGAEQVSRVEVISLAGQRLINEVNMGSSSIALSVDGLVSGVYVLRLTDNDKAINYQKLIVE